ncbi:hypothetical protein Trydic_g6433 [Trypoxylus dichotomus]
MEESNCSKSNQNQIGANSSENKAESKDSILRPNFVSKIREFLGNQGFSDINLKISPGSQKGDNYCGTLAQIEVQAKDTDGNQRVLKWISKSAPVEEAQRQTIKADALYEKEISVYEKIFPILHQFQTRKGIPSPFKAYPTYIMSYIEENQENFIMEDMKSLGFLMKDKKSPLDYNHAILVLETYAKLHAISYAMKDQAPEEFETLKMLAKDTYFCKQNYDIETVEKYEENYRRRIIGCLNLEEDARIIEDLTFFLTTPNSIVMDTIAEQNEYAIVIHGDNWINNILFKYGDPNNVATPTEVCLLDFQITRVGSPVLDIAYFIYSCTDKTFREEYFDQAIGIYHSALQQRITDLGSDPYKLIPFNVLKKEFKRFSVVGFYLATVILELMLGPQDETAEWSKAENVEELLEALNFKGNIDMGYKERIRDIIVDFVSRGCLDFLKCDK